LLLNFVAGAAYACLIFNFNVNWSFLRALGVDIVLRNPSVHGVVHHASRLGGGHLRSDEWVLASTSRWEMAFLLLILLALVKLLIVGDYVAADDAQGT